MKSVFTQLLAYAVAGMHCCSKGSQVCCVEYLTIEGYPDERGKREKEDGVSAGGATVRFRFYDLLWRFSVAWKIQSNAFQMCYLFQRPDLYFCAIGFSNRLLDMTRLIKK